MRCNVEGFRSAVLRLALLLGVAWLAFCIYMAQEVGG